MSQVAVDVIGLDLVGILTDDYDSVGRVLGDLIGLAVSGPDPEPKLGLEVLWVYGGEVRLEYGPSIEVVGQPPPDGSV